MMDAYDLWEDHDAEQEAWRNGRPVCSHCGEHIQDDRLFDINGEVYHIKCAGKEFCKYTDDYIYEL